jgi:hypothetical protein
MRKLCTDEVGEFKMKKFLKKKTGFAIRKKCIVFYYSYLATPLALHFKDDL